MADDDNDVSALELRIAEIRKNRRAADVAQRTERTTRIEREIAQLQKGIADARARIKTLRVELRDARLSNCGVRRLYRELGIEGAYDAMYRALDDGMTIEEAGRALGLSKYSATHLARSMSHERYKLQSLLALASALGREPNINDIKLSGAEYGWLYACDFAESPARKWDRARRTISWNLCRAKTLSDAGQLHEYEYEDDADGSDGGGNPE